MVMLSTYPFRVVNKIRFAFTCAAGIGVILAEIKKGVGKMLYKIALFLHITGASLLFAGLGIEIFSLLAIMNGSVQNQELALSNILKTNKISIAAMILVILPGMHLMSVWGGKSWIMVSFAGIIINSFLFMVVTRKKIKYVQKAVAENAGMEPSVKDSLLLDGRLWLSVNIRVAVILGIIMLMTLKPEPAISLATLILSILLGILFTMGKRWLRKKSAEKMVNKIQI